MILLYEAEQRSMAPADLLGQQVLAPDELTRSLVLGVAAHRDELDSVIAAHSKGWSLARMPALDRTILRIATFELFHRPDVPAAVVLDEGVELAKTFSTDDSGRFVNGVLAAIVPLARTA
jgi:N utilization substance protein B